VKRRSKSTLLKSRQRGYLRAVLDEGVGVCLPCGESFPTAALWKAHNALHVGRGEHLCALCGRTFTRATFSTHPCVGHSLGAQAAALPRVQRAGVGTDRNGGHTAEPRHLRVLPAPADSEQAS
jgi:hypothetical protein